MSRRVEVTCPACQGEMVMSVFRENYGADADGNRGEMRDDADVHSPCPKECELTTEQYERACAVAVEKNYSDESDYYAEPEEEAVHV